MSRDYRVFLEDIVESIQRIREYTNDQSHEEFSRDRKTQDAVIRINFHPSNKLSGKC